MKELGNKEIFGCMGQRGNIFVFSLVTLADPDLELGGGGGGVFFCLPYWLFKSFNL